MFLQQNYLRNYSIAQHDSQTLQTGKYYFYKSIPIAEPIIVLLLFWIIVVIGRVKCIISECV